LMTPGTLWCSTAVGTSEAASRHSCFCLPRLLRRMTGGEGAVEMEGEVLFNKMRSAHQGPCSKASLFEV
jgi:hypothetical protein